jgi:hypothetical protein
MLEKLKELRHRPMVVAIGLSMVALCAGMYIGFNGRPYRITTWEKIVYVEKEVTKQKVDKNVKTTTTKKPDGTTVTVVEDTSKIDTTTVKDTDASKESTKVVENKKPSLKLDIQANLDPFDKKITYGISADKQFIGPIWIGLYASTDKQFGVRIGWLF